LEEATERRSDEATKGKDEKLSCCSSDPSSLRRYVASSLAFTMIIIPPVFPRRRKKRAAIAAAPPIGLTITSVETATPAEQIIVRFSSAITWDGSSVPVEFKAFTSDEFFDSPINVAGVGADWIELEFNGSVSVGAAWELNGPMAGITPAVAFPQMGATS
jgi:hypothetical protein